MSFLYHFIFIVATIYILIKTIFYGLYEINTKNNKPGGISVICLSVFVVMLANIIAFIR